MNSEPHATRLTRKRKAATYDKDDAQPWPPKDVPLKKSKATSMPGSAPNTNIDKSTKLSKKKGQAGTIETEERRRRNFRRQAPKSYLEVKARALIQRLTVLSRERCGTDDVPEEKVVMAGSTGNVYTQHIGLEPRCNCPHAKKGHQCKHIIYVMLRVLKAKEEIAYQLALTSTELRELFENATPIPGAQGGKGETTEGEDGNRKPIEGECPICYTEFEAEKEAIVYCKAACGNNVHKDCMQSWIAATHGKATCPYCRAKWEDSEFDGKFGDVNLTGAERNEDGYLNVGAQLGLSGMRDYSSYHQPWVRQQFGGGRRRGYGYGYGYY